jgi:hypothetical protein
MFAEIGERGLKLHWGERRRPPGSDPLAAEAKAAIDRADRDQLQKRAVWVAMDDPVDRALQIIADRIDKFGGMTIEFARVGHELPRDRIGGIGGIDQSRQGRRNRHGIALGDALKFFPPLRRRKTRRDEIGGGFERARGAMGVREGHAELGRRGGLGVCSAQASAKE